MKTRVPCVAAILCLSAIVALAQKSGLEGTWVTDGVATVEAAIKAKKSLSGLPEGTKIKLKVDVKKGKVSGKINQLNTDKEFEVEDGKLTDNTFTFKSVEAVNNNSGFGGGFGGDGGFEGGNTGRN